jgi:hypothetical protein
MRSRCTALAVTIVLAYGCAPARHAAVPTVSADSRNADHDNTAFVQSVAGTGVHFFTTAIVHSKESTPRGTIQRSTETIEVSGDLTGRALYQATSVFDFSDGTMVNTGYQAFSGTIGGSSPVMLYDDKFRFDVNLKTGATVGEVHLTDNLAGPKGGCHLNVVGTGKTADGNVTFAYTGHCTFKTIRPPG